MLRGLVTQLSLQQLSQACGSCTCASSASSAVGMSRQQASQLQLGAAYSAKLNPKELKRQQKTERKKAKQEQQPSTAGAIAGEATSFTDEGQAVEADVTKLVLQVSRSGAAHGMV
eukprot:GHUV01006908.1.p1 GENE.GHUV01006908.1~~GHUV01006908.1.p1  ORF type:complete len:115 (+),score=38.09 GHUV01006908.1:682-1026(+)